jgi:putative membrane protein
MSDSARSRERLPLLPADLGATRTVLAADRTLMAWIRTSLSMLSFGFTIYKFLQAMAESNQIADSHSPQRIGLFLAAMGTFAMVIGTLGYWATLKELRASQAFRVRRPVLIIALLMSVAGLALFGSIWTRLV